MSTATNTTRAIAIIRVSQVNGREGDQFHSPEAQRERITAACESHDWRLLDVIEELDVSGATPLKRRSGLLAAVEAVEAGKADIIVGAYLDRLCRSVRVYHELIDRIEQAGGEVYALDMGRQSNGSALERMIGTTLASVAEYVRNATAERSAEAQARAIREGCPPYAPPPGFVRGADGRFAIDAATGELVRQAFAMRADGATVERVREFMLDNGITRSPHAVRKMFLSRTYLGEINFGDYGPNLAAHPALIDQATWERVQRTRPSRGRYAKSDRLLARLGVLRCATCGSRMVVGHHHQDRTPDSARYAYYRCGRVRRDCPARATISAEIVEPLVIAAVRERIAGGVGRADTSSELVDAEQRATAAHAARESTLRLMLDMGLQDDPTLRAALAEQLEACELADAEVERLRAAADAWALSAGTDWDMLSLAERRGLIQALIARVEVAPGRGPDRVLIEPFEQ